MFGNSMSKDWHSKIDFKKYICEYHNKHARQPDMSEAKALNLKVLDVIERRLRDKNLCRDLLYSGSTYENLKIGRKKNGNHDLEFDIMMIIGYNIVEVIDQPNGRPYLKATAKSRSISELQNSMEGDFINPIKLIQKFKGIYQTIINDLKYQESFLNKFEFKIRDHGPAIQLDVYKINNEKNLFYSVDFVPTFRVSDKYFIAKPQEGESLNWRRSFSVEERRIFNSIDINNGCCKMLLRAIKDIFKNEATLRALSSYQIKTVMMNLIKKYSHSNEWKVSLMFQRFIDYLKLLHLNLSNEKICHSFLHYNILNLNSFTIKNIRDRVANFLTKENYMLDLLTDAHKRIYIESLITSFDYDYDDNITLECYGIEEYEGNDFHDLIEFQKNNDYFSYNRILVLGVVVGALFGYANS